MLEVGADEDMKIPPLEWVGEEQEDNENQDQKPDAYACKCTDNQQRGGGA